MRLTTDIFGTKANVEISWAINQDTNIADYTDDPLTLDGLRTGHYSLVDIFVAINVNGIVFEKAFYCNLVDNANVSDDVEFLVDGSNLVGETVDEFKSRLVSLVIK